MMVSRTTTARIWAGGSGSDPGTYIVYYRKIPRLLESLSDELVIMRFYNAIENFVISMLCGQEQGTCG